MTTVTTTDRNAPAPVTTSRARVVSRRPVSALAICTLPPFRAVVWRRDFVAACGGTPTTNVATTTSAEDAIGYSCGMSKFHLKTQILGKNHTFRTIV